jgi:hypothetical protein
MTRIAMAVLLMACVTSSGARAEGPMAFTQPSDWDSMEEMFVAIERTRDEIDELVGIQVDERATCTLAGKGVSAAFMALVGAVGARVGCSVLNVRYGLAGDVAVVLSATGIETRDYLRRRDFKDVILSFLTPGSGRESNRARLTYVIQHLPPQQYRQLMRFLAQRLHRPDAPVYRIIPGDLASSAAPSPRSGVKLKSPVGLSRSVTNISRRFPPS